MTTISGVFEAFILGLFGNLLPGEDIRQAQAAIRAYRDDPNMGVAWKGLKKEDWCSRIELLLADPTPINQRPTGYCMPAACLYVLFKRAPAEMAGFCIGLARDGVGTIGVLTVTMTKELLDYDVPAFAKDWFKKGPVDPIYFILMLAMQNQMSLTDIKAPDDYASKPGFLVMNVTSLLSATQLFSKIDSIDHPWYVDLKDIDPTTTDVILFGNVEFFSTRDDSTGHAVILIPPIVRARDIVTFHFWSWGMFHGNQTLPIEGDAYVKQADEADFSDGIKTAVFVSR